MTLFITIVALSVVGWLIATTIVKYRQATGTKWERLLSSAKGSATLLWSKFMLLCSFATAGLTNLADYISDPNLSAAIKAVLTPEHVAYFMIVVTAITIYARHRSLGK